MTLTLIEVRRDLAVNWFSVNPTLAEGEPGLEIDTGKLKIGDGRRAWNVLGYVEAGLTAAQRTSYFMDMVPSNRGIDQTVNGLYGTITTSGVPTKSFVLWPDGARGTFTATTLNPGLVTGSEASTIDAYTATYRRIGDTSATDRTDWIPNSSTAYLSGSPLSDAQAAALVTRVPELMANHIAPFAPNPGSTPRNYYIPTPTDLATYYANAVSEWLYPGHLFTPNPQLQTINPYFQFVTGACGTYIPNPTTDEIVQWASHKWGIPTEWLRAETHLESRWDMDFLGDLNPVNAYQPVIGGTETDNNWALYPPWSQVPGGWYAWRSLSMIQVQWIPNSGTGVGSEPLRWMSTAFAMDYAGAYIRYYFDDPGGHRTAWGDPSYFAGDTRAQMGWFSPYPWANGGGIILTGVDGTSQLQIATYRIFGNWTATVRTNAGTPANKDLLVFNAGSLVKQYLNVGGGTIQHFADAINADDLIQLGASVTGTGTNALANVTNAPGWTGGALNYYDGIIQRTKQQPWLTAEFSNIASAVTIHRQPLITRGADGLPSVRPLPDTVPYVPPEPPPGPPINVVAYPGDGEIWMWWTPPVDDGGSPEQFWMIFETDQGWGAFQTFNAVGWLWSGLPNGASLRFSIQAYNGIGWSPWSAPSNVATPTPGLPKQPSALQATANYVDGSIQLSWIPNP